MNDKKAYINHVSITVPDLDMAERFYMGVLNLQEVSRKTWQIGDARMDAILGLKNTSGRKLVVSDGFFEIELWEFITPSSTPNRQDRPVSDCGYTHFGLAVPDMKAIYDRLCAAGVKFHTPPSLGPTGNQATYGRDPFGNVIEFIELGK